MTALFASRGAFAPRSFLYTRTFSTRGSLLSDKPPFAFSRGPSPPQLPKEEQKIFEDLQRQSTGAFTTPKVNQSPASEANVDKGKHRDAPQGLKPEFEGDKNPKTGEVGGPKNEPLRWGAEGDWSYGGRVTDF